MDETNEPTVEEVALMAMAAKDAAFGKAEELGYSRLYGLCGLEYAWETCEKTMGLINLLGPELANALGEALEKSEIQDTIQQAEDVLREGE